MYINSEHKRGNDFLDEQKFEDALSAFNKALELNPKHPDILSHRGVTFLHLNQKKNCLTDLELALELEKDNAYRYASLAYAMDYFGDLDEAISLYEKAVEVDPDDAISYNNLGLLLEKKGYNAKAQKVFENADAIALNNPELNQEIEQSINKDSSLPKPDRNKVITNAPVGEQIQPKKILVTKTPTVSQVSKDLFTKKSTFKEFISFVKNGFKLKQE